MSRLLPLDRHYFQNRHSTFVVQVEGECPRFGIRGSDRLIVDRSMEPKEDSLVLAVINQKFTVIHYKNEFFVNQDPEKGDFVWGQIKALIRDFK